MFLEYQPKPVAIAKSMTWMPFRGIYPRNGEHNFRVLEWKNWNMTNLILRVWRFCFVLFLHDYSASFCLFRCFLTSHRWRAWESNPGQQDGRRRQIHWAMVVLILHDRSFRWQECVINFPVSFFAQIFIVQTSGHLSSIRWSQLFSGKRWWSTGLAQ